jgi:hypothetical protein
MVTELRKLRHLASVCQRSGRRHRGHQLHPRATAAAKGQWIADYMSWLQSAGTRMSLWAEIRLYWLLLCSYLQ